VTAFSAAEVVLGDNQIHYVEAGSGPSVVFLHGGGGLRIDPPVFDALAARFRLLAPSLPGFDQSTATGIHDVRDIADVVAEFIGAVGGGSAMVIGESFGGMTASWLAIRHPEVVSRLVLAAPAGLRQEDGPTLQQLSREDISELLFGKPRSAPPDPEQVARAQRNRQFMASLPSRGPFDHELHEQLAQITAPTLVVWGTADRLIWPSQARYFVERIPDARLVLLEGAAHALAAAAPEAFLDAVLPFLQAALVSEAQPPAR
jgi:pimeloyl-ACP methyl ester carboxylesterase